MRTHLDIDMPHDSLSYPRRRVSRTSRKVRIPVFTGITGLRQVIPALLLILLAVVAFPLAAPAQERSSGKTILYFFWGDGCPHCSEEKVFLAEMQKGHPKLDIRSFEVWKNRANALYFTDMAKASGIQAAGVPVTMLDTRTFVGFSKDTREQLGALISQCEKRPCADPTDRLQNPLGSAEPERVKLLFVGEIEPAKVSLPFLTLVLAAMDSINPCAFFVLLFLLSLMVHAKSRRKMLLIGSTFVFFSGFVYFVFMAAWLNLFMVAGSLRLITFAAGIVAVIVAAINIKDYFLFKQGVSLSIPESAKPRLFERMRGLLKTSSVPALLAGTAVLALAANSYELLCTAGFPMVFTRVLTLQKLPVSTYYIYLAAYNIVYVIPLFLIVLAFTATLGARKLTEWEGRKMKLLSGLMMLLLGGVLLAKPSLLNNVLAAAALPAAALVLCAAIIAATKKKILLPPGS